jgi:hypothetical protein
MDHSSVRQYNIFFTLPYSTEIKLHSRIQYLNKHQTGQETFALDWSARTVISGKNLYEFSNTCRQM